MIPRKVKLRDVVEINPTAKVGHGVNEDVSFLAMADVSVCGHIETFQQRSLAEVRKGYTSFCEGDVILAKITPCFENGKAAIVEGMPMKLGFGSTEFHVLRPSDAIDVRFLFHLIWNPGFRRIGSSRMTGSAGQKRVPTAYLADYEFVLPSLGEQKRIAAILDKADSLRRKRQEAILLADDLLRATFFEMFGDPVTNNKHWPERAIAEIAVVTTGNTPSRQIEAYYGDAIEWIKSDNINTPSHFLTKSREGLSAFGETVGRTVPAGSTLMTCIAGSPSCIGNVAMADRKIAFNQQINAVTPFSGVEPEFMYGLLLLSKQRIQASSTSSMKGMVSKGALEKVKLIWPPSEQQETFVKIFRQIQRMRFQMSKADVSDLVDALQSKLLT